MRVSPLIASTRFPRRAEASFRCDARGIRNGVHGTGIHAAAQQAASIFVTESPSGYRDWTLISFTYEEGDLHRFAAVLANDVAIKAL